MKHHIFNLMKKRLLYLRGEPGSGKITTATALSKVIGWNVLWFHDFDFLRPMLSGDADRVISDMACAAIGASKENLIYVRPSRLCSTVERVRDVAIAQGFDFQVVRLKADYATLCIRVMGRKRSPWRIGSVEELNGYLESYYEDFPGEITVSTTGASIGQVVNEVLRALHESAFATSAV